MSDDNRMQKWAPPARPEWVQRVNEEGRHLDLKSVVPLDEASLLAWAQANTGLSDFGSDDWREPFRLYLKALNEEACLNLVGRLMTRQDILVLLEARLRVEELYKQHPEINDVELAPIAMIVGAGRSGTSVLQNLLSLDPGNATPKHWEAMFPVPAPEAATYHSDPRIALADQRMTMWNRVTPEIMSMHEFGGDVPTELMQLEALAFQGCAWLDLLGFVPSYDGYCMQHGFVHGLSYAKRVLKVLQWKHPRQRWILKSPDSMRYLTDLFQVFPDLQLVWTHRDPIKTMASAVSLTGTLFWIRSDQQFSDAAWAELTNPAGLAGRFNKVMDYIEQGQIPGSQVRSVQYLDLVENPLGAVEQLYRELGFELTPTARQAMENYLEEHPREARPVHKYSVGDAAQQAADRQHFARYQAYFQVKSEV